MIPHVKPLRVTVVLVALALGACSSEVLDTPCSPACPAGQTCSFGICQAYCNPACGASEQCVVVKGATRCVGVDGGVVRDVGPELPPPIDAPVDGGDVATPTEASVDTASEPPPPPDAPDDQPADAIDLDVFFPPDALDASADAVEADGALDASADRLDAPGTDAGMDAGMDVGMDAQGDVTVDAAPPDGTAPDAYTPPVCGAAGQPCCGGVGGDVACRAGLVCNAFERGRCVAATGAEPTECVATAMCTGGRVCQGPTFCGTRACMRCAVAGMLPYDAVCDPRMGGSTCATGVCLTGRCSWACAPGTAGDAECSRRAPNTRCQEAYYGINLMAMRPTAWVTLGSCVPVCRRNADCPMGRVCAAVPSLLDDRVDYSCVPEGRLPSGSACTASEMCQSFLCLSIPGTGRRCSAPCVSDGDCPATQRCGEVQLLRPTSDAEQSARGCLPR
jgi:hypothetical protein